MRAVHRIESYNGQCRKSLKVPKLKYLVVQKCETKYGNEMSRTKYYLNLIFYRSTARKNLRKKYLKVHSDTIQLFLFFIACVRLETSQAQMTM